MEPLGDETIPSPAREHNDADARPVDHWRNTCAVVQPRVGTAPARVCRHEERHAVLELAGKDVLEIVAHLQGATRRRIAAPRTGSSRPTTPTEPRTSRHGTYLASDRVCTIQEPHRPFSRCAVSTGNAVWITLRVSRCPPATSERLRRHVLVRVLGAVSAWTPWPVSAWRPVPVGHPPTRQPAMPLATPPRPSASLARSLPGTVPQAPRAGSGQRTARIRWARRVEDYVSRGWNL